MTGKKVSPNNITQNGLSTRQSEKEMGRNGHACGDKTVDQLPSHVNNGQLSGETSSPVPELTSRAKVIVLASCMCVNFLCIGFSLGLGVVFVQILDVFNTTRAQTSLMQSLCIGVIFSGSLICGPIVHKLTPGNSMILGGFLSMVGCVGATFAPNVDVLIVTVGFITGAIRDVTGDYLLMFYLASGVAVVMGAVFFTLELWMRRRKTSYMEETISEETIDTKL
ncbi:monocarboxylate transporter 2-like [Haliotis rubra]|uniref:monocarboxylate transporter 2-like n=1 Tax=Haliotis rubra TaxID=36100 RepID=UPI001EE5D500|nr:monocarboxylate transporter 2-like [Haliotis rubra]